MIFDDDALMALNECLRHFSCNETAGLFFGRCALEQHAGLGDDQPIILRQPGLKPRGVVAPLASPEKPPGTGDRFRPDDRIEGCFALMVKLVLKPVPHQWPSRYAIAIIGKPV